MDRDHEYEIVQLLTDHQPVIRAFVISLLPGAPGVDDVIQETNKIIWMKRDEFELGTSFSAWALTIARFQVMTHWRVLKKQRWVTLDSDVVEQLAGDMADQSDSEFTAKRIKALRSCIERVRPEDRELLIQRYWRNTRLQDFAVIHRRTIGGLKVQLFRLRAALKRCIENHLEDPCNS